MRRTATAATAATWKQKFEWELETKFDAEKVGSCGSVGELRGCEYE